MPVSLLSPVWVGLMCNCCHALGTFGLLLVVLLPQFLFRVGTMLLGGQGACVFPSGVELHPLVAIGIK